MRSQWLAVILAACLSGCFMAPSHVAAEIRDINQPPSLEFSALNISDKYQKAYLLTLKLLQQHHYRKENLADLSADIFDDYLDLLDSARIYLLQSDVDAFADQRSTFLRHPDAAQLRVAFDIFDRYRRRANALNDWTLERLQQPFDLDTDDTLYAPPYHVKAKRERPKTLAEATAYQEQRLIDQIIRLMLSGKTKEEAIKTLVTRYENINKRLNRTSSDDVFDVFMNAVTTRFDPHTNYFSPRISEDFDINMRLSLEGIGAVLGIDDEKVMIRQLIPGGPAAKSGKLHIRDKIIGVAQGEDGEMVDVVGWRLDKAVKLIRGEKGSSVRLLVEPVNGGAAREVVLQREKIDLEDQGAHAYVENVSEDGVMRKIGVLRLPSFYMDFDGAQHGNKNFRSTSKDVKRLLNELKTEGVEGVIVDLRGNGGGSLYEAVQTVGLFIDQGPVVAVSSADGDIREERDEQAGAAYDGPLAVLIDHYSASASEIFAAAIQDYQRGLIIGSNSFGKGTVQTVIDLNRFVPKGEADLGKVKFTIAMFHRVNGDTTQLKGVAPDITLPEGLGLDVVGERAEPHALPWKAVRPSQFKPAGVMDPALIAAINARHQARMTKDPALKRYQKFVNRVTVKNDQAEWSLNLQQRRKEYQDWDDYSKHYEQAQRDDVPDLASDSKRKKDIAERNQYVKDENDLERFVPDVALYEALNIFYDYLAALQPSGR